jgi:LIM and SH3 domain protein 1
LPHYQPQPPVFSEKETPSPQKTSPGTSFDASNNYENNNGQQYPASIPANNKYQQQPPPPAPNSYNTNGNGPIIRTSNIVHGASMPAGGISSNQQMQQQLQQKYYDQYESFGRANGNSAIISGGGGNINNNATNNNINNINNNNNNNNGNINSQMSQSSYSNPKAYGHPQMTSSYNQQQMQMNLHNMYNHHQNGTGVGKISDYDPLTDGPRNVPQTGRPNQTLIYSSDRAASKLHTSFISIHIIQK